MKFNHWYLVESSQTWLNLMHVESIYRVNNQWTARTQTGTEVPLTDNEYWGITDAIRLRPEHTKE